MSDSLPKIELDNNEVHASNKQQAYEERFAEHSVMFEHFQSSFSQFFPCDLVLDDNDMYLTIISTYDDIERYKSYHLPEGQKADAVKRAAYITKWITKFKPIKCNGHQLDLTSKAVLVNELFACQVAMVHLSDLIGKQIFLSPNKEYELIYSLLYRDISSDALILFYQTIVELANGAEILR